MSKNEPTIGIRSPFGIAYITGDIKAIGLLAVIYDNWLMSGGYTMKNDEKLNKDIKRVTKRFNDHGQD